MNLNESRILDFIVNEIEVEEGIVLKFVEEKTVPPAVQDELWENYPETLLKLAPKMTLTEDVTIKMIKSKNPLFLKVVMTKSLTEVEQLAIVETVPELIKEYQDSLSEDDCLFPEVEEAYRKAKEENPQLPDITYIWKD